MDAAGDAHQDVAVHQVHDGVDHLDAGHQEQDAGCQGDLRRGAYLEKDGARGRHGSGEGGKDDDPQRVVFQPGKLLLGQKAQHGGGEHGQHGPQVSVKQAAEGGVAHADQEQVRPAGKSFGAHHGAECLFHFRNADVVVHREPAQFTELLDQVQVERQGFQFPDGGAAQRLVILADQAHGDIALENGHVRAVSVRGGNAGNVAHGAVGVHPRAHEGGGVFQQEFRKGLYLVGVLHKRERGGQGREARFLEA